MLLAWHGLFVGFLCVAPLASLSFCNSVACHGFNYSYVSCDSGNVVCFLCCRTVWIECLIFMLSPGISMILSYHGKHTETYPPMSTSSFMCFCILMYSPPHLCEVISLGCSLMNVLSLIVLQFLHLHVGKVMLSRLPISCSCHWIIMPLALCTGWRIMSDSKPLSLISVQNLGLRK